MRSGGDSRSEPSEERRAGKMRMRRELSSLRAPLVALAMVVGLTASGRSGSVALARVRATLASSPPATTECEGEACPQVSLTFDADKQQYLARNNSSDRWVKVSASNLSSFASACVGPGKSDYLKLKSVVGPYRAEYDEGCGASALGR
jgi:hypothetical protein